MKVTFYLPDLNTIPNPDQLDPFNAWKEMPRGEGFWILQTYCLLRHFDADVAISDSLPDDGILVFHRRNRAALFKEPQRELNNLVLVGCRGDLHDVLIGDFELLQNSFFADNTHKFAMPHWPMPGIKPRDPARGAHLKRISFKGFAKQLHEDFQDGRWQAFLDDLGIEWVQEAVAFTHQGGSQFDDAQWNDYQNIDAILAVRPERNNLHTNKPALKLYNAWHAGVVPILGPEYAYREVGEDGVDYLEVSNLEQAKQAVLELVQNPDRFLEFVEQGRRKAPSYTHAAVAECWKEFLFQTVPEQWQQESPSLFKRLGRKLPIGLRYQLLNVYKKATFQRLR